MIAVQTPHTSSKAIATLPRSETPVAANTSKEPQIATTLKPETIPYPSQDALLPSRQKQLSLLLVEDNPTNLKLLIASLNMGHAYSTVTDDSQAVALCCNADSTHNRRFNIIFIDIQMLVEPRDQEI